MAIASTASSGTDEPDGDVRPGSAEERGQGPPSRGPHPPAEPRATDLPAAAEPAAPTASPPAAPVPPAAPSHDAGRRAFFRQFGRQAVTAVGQVAAMTDVVGRASSLAAAGLLGSEERRGSAPAGAFTPASPARRGGAISAVPSRPAAEDAYRSPYRLAGNELILLDQRSIPRSLDEVTAKRGSDVAYYLRLGVCRGGPLMAQVAAHGLALTAAERQDHPLEGRALELRRTRVALQQARPSSRLTIRAMERMEAVERSLGPDVDGPALAAALRAEAEAIASELQAALAAISGHLAQALPAPEGRPLGVLVHGDPGPLAGGLLGTGITALARLAEQGRALRVFVTEGRPFMDGARLASWELRQAGIGHKVLADSAVAWLLAREPIDVVLTDASWIAANGDAAALIGGRALAAQVGAASGAGEGSPRLIVSAPIATIDPRTPDGAGIPDDPRPARELTAYLADVPVRAGDSLVPSVDIIPAAAIDALVTEAGVVSPVSPEALAGLATASPGAGSG